jgi:hypothetical protein
MWNQGSPAKTGEYQDLKPSPFWDFDGISSDGRQTLNVYGTGTDNESSKAGLNYYRGNFRANVDYDRFIHRRDHDPLNDMPNPSAAQLSPPQDPKIIKQDLNVGQDYAVRVQELKASFKGKLSDNLKARLDVWGMQKDGTRQANAVAMCYANEAGNGVPPAKNPNNLQLPPDHPPLTQFAGNRCHVLSQMQQIDWITTEIKPVIETRLGDSIDIEYSRPMRGFTAADQTVTRYYDRVGKLSYSPTTNSDPYAYGVVPDSYTQMDQLKIGVQLTENTKAYAFLMVGSTVNQEIDMDRWFNNSDIRLTNTSIENLTLTGYGKIFNEDEATPNLAKVIALNPENPPNTIDTVISSPINYHKTTAGTKGVWRPGGHGFGLGGLAILTGYEYCDLDRENAIYDLDTGGVIDESHTITNSFQIGPDMRWSPAFDTFLRYKFQNAAQPLLGVQEENGLTNTLLPQIDHIVEIGFNWFPSDCFMLNACVGIERGETHGLFGDSTTPINFDQENYPMSFTAWYAASNKLSLSAGYAVYSSFVAQNITLADQSTFTGDTTQAVAPVTSRWNYGAQSHVVTFGSRYAATERLILTGQVEWVHGLNQITDSSVTFPSNITVTDLGSYSKVLNTTTRVTMGADWVIRPRIVNYYRYELYDFFDQSPGYQSGVAQGFMGGLSALF